MVGGTKCGLKGFFSLSTRDLCGNHDIVMKWEKY